jgi:hypothetical protein
VEQRHAELHAEDVMGRGERGGERGDLEDLEHVKYDSWLEYFVLE